MGVAPAETASPRSGSLTASDVLARNLVPGVLAANLVAALVVYFYLWLLAPTGEPEERFGLEIAAFGGYVLATAAAALPIFRRTFAPVAQWLDDDREPTERELELTLEQPFRQSLWVVGAWSGGAIGFGGAHMIPANSWHYDPAYGVFIGTVGLLGGLTAAMLSYLMVERRLRSIFALALDRMAAQRPRALGVRQRIVVSWALGSGVILVAIALTPFATQRLEEAIWFLAPVGLIGGGVIIAIAARSVSEPITAMRSALARVEKGELDARVEVDDGSEVGLLQAGFNRMAAGLEERERLRSIFGTYVDRDIAEHILKSGTSLTGEEVEVTIMFLDIRGFTGFAERSPAQEVVATINRLFGLVVPIVHEHQGHVDKFVGDGALAVFGAPRRHPDHAGLAVKAAVAIIDEVRDEFAGELEVGIGVNSGSVVAGNVGGGGRLEFSVIGDSVNLAARIESATRITGDTILVSESTKALLQDPSIRLVERTDVQLKGKRDPVCLFAIE